MFQGLHEMTIVQSGLVDAKAAEPRNAPREVYEAGTEAGCEVAEVDVVAVVCEGAKFGKAAVLDFKSAEVGYVDEGEHVFAERHCCASER